jgi:hypothetical protein
VNYTGNGISYLYDVVGIIFPDTNSQNEQTYNKALFNGGSLFSQDNGPDNEGDIVIENLKNGSPVEVGIGYVNKWKFVTMITASEPVTPEQIKTFLQKKKCYLLSAGFGGEHYVIEYFRNFRDHTLLKSGMGRSFVRWYYKTAPYYAQYVSNNVFLRYLVRGIGYFLYFLFNYFWISILVPFLAIAFIKGKKVQDPSS